MVPSSVVVELVTTFPEGVAPATAGPGPEADNNSESADAEPPISDIEPAVSQEIGSPITINLP